VLVFRRPWEQLGLDKLLADLQDETEIQFPLDEAVFGMMLHGLLDLVSKRTACKWLETVYPQQFIAVLPVSQNI
jgi:hypothetical protein